MRGVVYGRGPNDSFVALDAATGKQRWIHEGVKGFTVRGANYWESKDAKDRRLIFSVNNLLQEIDAQTGEAISSFGSGGTVDLRVGLDRDPATINQQSRLPGRVFENLVIMGSATNQEYGSAPGAVAEVARAALRVALIVWVARFLVCCLTVLWRLARPRVFWKPCWTDSRFTWKKPKPSNPKSNPR